MRVSLASHGSEGQTGLVPRPPPQKVLLPPSVALLSRWSV